MKDLNQIQILLDKYLDGTANVEERATVESWYNNYSAVDRSERAKNLVDSDLAEVKARLLVQTGTRGGSVISMRKQTALVAAAVAAIVFAIWFFFIPRYSGTSLSRTKGRALTNDIAPGKNTATITFSGDKSITLNDTKNGVVIGNNKLTYSDGSPISLQEVGFSDQERMVTAATPRGGTYRIILPDGTEVRLNAASKITFPAKFKDRERRIILDGEAYFKVVHNARQPFIVESRGQEVKDIGTEFNINCYTDEGLIRTTLVEGSAEVSSLISASTLTLYPKQQATLANRTLKMTEVNVDDVVAWTSGTFSFTSESITSIMRKVARWYDIDIIYETNVSDISFTGSVNRYYKLSTLLDKLQQTGALQFDIEGRKVIVKDARP
uniref:FecR family protein n=1 Tax=Pedobacter schmidteae TaxID=2201271 RepID=UPI000EB3F27F|nr:FecR family protein [Pedobacter schmidteae]